MAIYFSEKFKNFRKDKNLTQEQIAEIFHISPQSVSRWETGATYPDIEILPHLALFFEVTIDELLGKEEIFDEKRIGELSLNIRKLLEIGKVYDAIDAARKAVKEYPLNGDLQWDLTQVLWTASKIKGAGEKYKSELIEMAEKSIGNLEPNPSCGGKVNLVRQYAEWGMMEQAKKVLETLPAEVWDTQEPWEGLLLEGDEYRKNQQGNICRFAYLLTYTMTNYANKADIGLDILQKIECLKAVKQINSLINDVIVPPRDEGGVIFLTAGRAKEYIAIAELYCEAQDIENALDYTEKATQNAVYYCNNMDKKAFHGYEINTTPRNLCWILWEDTLVKPQFDIIRDNKRFIKCIDELKANSRELK